MWGRGVSITSLNVLLKMLANISQTLKGAKAYQPPKPSTPLHLHFEPWKQFCEFFVNVVICSYFCRVSACVINLEAELGGGDTGRGGAPLGGDVFRRHPLAPACTLQHPPACAWSQCGCQCFIVISIQCRETLFIKLVLGLFFGVGARSCACRNSGS